MNNFFIGTAYMVLAQVGTYIQLNCGAKYNWYEKYTFLMLFASIPISWLYIKSVKFLMDAFNGELWPQRLVGFGIGVFIFAFMSYTIFKEPINTKTLISLFLSLIIILIQVIL